MKNLYVRNHPKGFWCFADEVSEDVWADAIEHAKPLLGIVGESADVNELMQLVLGEGQFGGDHWNLGSMKRLYYNLKPIIPRPITRIMRQLYQPLTKKNFPLGWPVEERYAMYLWEIGRQIISMSAKTSMIIHPFWPGGSQFALVLTHDVETGRGLDFIRHVADLEEGLGFRSSFNFVPERYSVNQSLISELKERGFEIGLHGLKHDGKLFSSRHEFERRAKLINKYLQDFGCVGFRSPLTHRHPEWMQILDVEYDLSFFDTDPYEPISGGTMSLWPFFVGHFIELPYTLVQDYTLTSILGETAPQIWLAKIDLIEKYYGMALVNSHPDYLAHSMNWQVYHDFLIAMKNRKGYWHALPRDVARWWKSRTINGSLKGGNMERAVASLRNGEIVISYGSV